MQSIKKYNLVLKWDILIENKALVIVIYVIREFTFWKSMFLSEIISCAVVCLDMLYNKFNYFKHKTLVNQNFICKTQFHPLRDLQLQFKSEK